MFWCCCDTLCTHRLISGDSPPEELTRWDNGQGAALGLAGDWSYAALALAVDPKDAEAVYALFTNPAGGQAYLSRGNADGSFEWVVPVGGSGFFSIMPALLNRVSLAISPTADRIAISTTGNLRLFDSSGAQIMSLSPPSGFQQFAAVWHEGNLYAVAHKDNAPTLWATSIRKLDSNGATVWTKIIYSGSGRPGGETDYGNAEFRGAAIRSDRVVVLVSKFGTHKLIEVPDAATATVLSSRAFTTASLNGLWVYPGGDVGAVYESTSSLTDRRLLRLHADAGLTSAWSASPSMPHWSIPGNRGAKVFALDSSERVYVVSDFNQWCRVTGAGVIDYVATIDGAVIHDTSSRYAACVAVGPDDKPYIGGGRIDQA